MNEYKTIEDLGNLSGKVAMLRADLNVPMDENFHVTNTARIDRTVPTIKELMSKGAKVVVISHFGRPEGKGDMKNSLSHVAPELEKALGYKVVFVEDCIGEKVENAIKSMKADEVLLLENLRFYDEEKKGDENFAKELTKAVDVYVSDAFSTENELNLTTEAFLSTEVVGMETFDSRIDSSITASEDIPRIDKILAVDGAYLTRTSLTFNDGELSSEGTVHLNIIYLNDEEDSINAVSVEVPYSYNEKLSIQGSNVVATDQIIEIDASVKRGRDIYVDGKIRTQVLVTNEVQTAAISGAELGEKLEERDGALEIYFAQEGKSFWDVAKDLKVSEDALRQQNPEIVEPFEKDEKIVYFEQFEISVD